MLRELRADDADAVAALIAHANPLRRIDAGEVRSWLGQTWLDEDDLRVLEEGGRAVAYVDVAFTEDVAHVDPNGPGREDELLEWAEGRARAKGAATARVRIWERQDDLLATVARRGYERVRSSFEMVIELGDEPPAPAAWPDGTRVRTYRHPDDELLAYELQEETFRDVWDYRPLPLEHWRELEPGRRGFDPSLWFLADAGGEPAGLCLAFPEHGGDAGLGWISVLGVRRASRRRGLGEALLRHAFRELHARGLRRVGLGVDAESPTGATRLYERAGMRVVLRSETWDKQL